VRAFSERGTGDGIRLGKSPVVWTWVWLCIALCGVTIIMGSSGHGPPPPMWKECAFL
jgi:hypothetical protein